ncbi:YihY/virulence factor BrkB family protein [Streptomyces purpurogeneiscleroticus]|uniref:YihY/virulence factor BrkB family protein n=1 Tax=Streptomyces purpurogeneiscleroticus TaxID=68259 RepID=UPI001CBCB77B|nr:YihY/virulence factor BrkB family protein [Streptomyces purpurogeneiscleroticus]MBZ4020704.1 ribonuclease [Streptomyces purpurogeneiscleroticus]
MRGHQRDVNDDGGGGGASAGGRTGGGQHRAPKGPGDLPKASWTAVLKRTAKEFKKDNLTDLAAALTYYGVLAIFPAALALVSILGLMGSGTLQPMIDNVGKFAPGAARDLITSMLKQMQGSQGKAGIALVIGILVALWSASGYIAAFMRAANTVYDIGEGRPAWKILPTRFLITVVTVVLLAVISVAVVFTGSLAQKAGDVIGLGSTAITVWNIAKWPVMVLLVGFIIALLYWAAPNVKRRFRWVTPGSLLAVLLWLVASALFALYVANFSSYNKTYGSLAGIIIFLVWLWISNLAILLGLEFNAEMERSRALEAGHPGDEEPYVEPRDTRKL